MRHSIDKENNEVTLIFDVDGQPLTVVIRVDENVDIARERFAALVRSMPQREEISGVGDKAYLIKGTPSPDCTISFILGNVFVHVTAPSETLARSLAHELAHMIRAE